jgi:putative membrane protein
MKITLIGAAAAALLLAAHPTLAATEADCVQAFEKADADKNGTLTAAEASDYYATMRTANKPAPAADMSKDAFITDCKANMKTAENTDSKAKMDPNAPLEGANSFTEGQAKDRIVAAGYTDVSKLAKDDKGIWRGTAMQGGNKIDVAVDYQGNVVAK